MAQRQLFLPPWRVLWTLGAASVCLGLPGTLAAQECDTDADCMDGMVCTDHGAVACPAPPPCEPGQDCPDIEFECPEEVFRFCEPGPCESDADCGDDLRCKTFESVSCPGSRPIEPCVEGEDCAFEEPEPLECTSESYSQCVPAWSGDCSVDADCGPGFTCMEAESCWCSAGSAGPGEDAPIEAECGCEPSGHFYCKLNEVECDDDGDCDDGLTCQEAFNGAVSDCAVPRPEPAFAQGGSGGASGSGEDSAEPDGDPDEEDDPSLEPFECEPEVVEPRSLCLPPNYMTLGGPGGGIDFLESADAAALGQPGSATGAPRAAATGEDDNDGASGSTGSGDGAGLLCSAGAGVSGAHGLWLALGPALLWWRRRGLN